MGWLRALLAGLRRGRRFSAPAARTHARGLSDPRGSPWPSATAAPRRRASAAAAPVEQTRRGTWQEVKRRASARSARAAVGASTGLALSRPGPSILTKGGPRGRRPRSSAEAGPTPRKAAPQENNKGGGFAAPRFLICGRWCGLLPTACAVPDAKP